MATRKKAGSGTNERVEIKGLNVKVAEINIRGFDGPLVVHNWSEKAVREMLEKQMSHKKGKTSKVAKDPEAQYRSSLYIMATKDKKERYGFPVTAFKNAMVRATKILRDTKQSDLDMITARQCFFVLPDGEEDKKVTVSLPEGGTFTENIRTELVEIVGAPRRRMDMVRISGGTADVRFRAEFPKWTAKLRVQFNTDVLDEQTIANLVYRAGMTVGIGEGRPEKGDQGWGRYEVL